jgi:hypothetical protein
MIVLDTNSMPHGQFSAAAMQRIADVVGQGASYVIPEVVLWEWAEHARSAQIALEEAVRGYRVDTGLMARPSIAKPISADDLITSIRQLLPSWVDVWEPGPESWRNGVRDQVLQVGSGERKRDVKTGAADSIVLSCVEHQASVADGAVVLLTSDKQLRESASAIEGVLVASGSGDLLRSLSSFTPASEDLELRLMENLPTFFNERIAEGYEDLSFAETGILLDLDGSGMDPGAADGLARVEVADVEIAEIHDLQIEADSTELLTLADLRIFGRITADIVTYQDAGLGELRASRQTVDFSREFIDVSVVVRWDHNWQFQSVVPAGVAVLVVTNSTDDEDDDVPRFRAVPKGQMRR